MNFASSAYCAGLFDGEGNVTIFKQAATGNYHLMLRLSMTHEAGVRHFRALVGCGTVRKQPSRGIRVCSWVWHISRRQEVERLLHSLQPHLVVKEKEAHIGLTFLGSENKQEKRQLWIAMGALKTRHGPRGCPSEWRHPSARTKEGYLLPGGA